jgi:hypothetical protein
LLGGFGNVLAGSALVPAATLSYPVGAILVKRVFAEVPSLHVAAGAQREFGGLISTTARSQRRPDAVAISLRTT